MLYNVCTLSNQCAAMEETLIKVLCVVQTLWKYKVSCHNTQILMFILFTLKYLSINNLLIKLYCFYDYMLIY